MGIYNVRKEGRDHSKLADQNPKTIFGCFEFKATMGVRNNLFFEREKKRLLDGIRLLPLTLAFFMCCTANSILAPKIRAY
jgi:hypothetical protein